MIAEYLDSISFTSTLPGKGKNAGYSTCTVALLSFAWEKGNYSFPSRFPPVGRAILSSGKQN